MQRLFLLLLAGALPLSAQVVIDPGMPKSEVLTRLGAPAVERSTGDATFLFFTNGCERTCGMNDLIVLEKGVVTDAVFRSAKRRYSGTSSSPRMIPAAEAIRAKPTPPEQRSDGPITFEIKGRKPTSAAR